MLKPTFLLPFLIALAIVLAACAAPAAIEPSAMPEPTSTNTPYLEPLPPDLSVPTLPPTMPPVLETRPDTIPINSEPLLSLRKLLAEQLRLSVDEIGLLEMRQETWSDGCLGAALPGEMCTMALVPGYLLIFQTPMGKIEVHTDEAMRFYRIVPSLISGSSSPLVSWNRWGGIAGICWQMHIYKDATYQILDCISQQILSQGSLPQGILEEILTLAADMAPHEWTTPKVQGADMFTDLYIWFGPGDQPADPLAQEQFNIYLGSLATLLVK